MGGHTLPERRLQLGTFSSHSYLSRMVVAFDDAGFSCFVAHLSTDRGQDKSGVLFYSVKGPGSMHAPLFVSLVIGLTDTSMENVSHAATSRGWNLKGVEPDGTGFRITISKE